MLGSVRGADAGPGWCPTKDKLVQGGKGDTLRAFEKGERSAGDAVEAVVYLTCENPSYVEPEDRKLADSFRVKLSDRLGMTDADWADAADWTHGEASSRVNLELAATNKKAAWSSLDPVEQYATVQRPSLMAANQYGTADPAYAADALGPKLSQAGRLAYVRECLRSDKPIAWAMCNADIDAIDGKALFAELHADKAHDGYARMTIRLAYDWVREHAPKRAAEIKKLVAKDPAFGKLFEIAAAQRKAWDARWKNNADMVALAAAMDDALVTNSRRAAEGCHDKTWEALKKAIAKLPAKAFATPRKSSDETYFYNEDVEQKVIGSLLSDPDAYLASEAFAVCESVDREPHSNGDPLAGKMYDRLERWPGHRGPRSSTFSAIVLANIQFDDRDTQLDHPDFERFWFRQSGGGAGGVDGVVESVKPADKMVTVSFQQKLRKETVDTGCTQSNRIHSIRPNGSLEYEVNCTGSKTITVDARPSPQKVKARYTQGLKPGMPVVIENDIVLAAWAKPGTATPSIVLGVPVK